MKDIEYIETDTNWKIMQLPKCPDCDTVNLEWSNGVIYCGECNRALDPPLQLIKGN